MRNRCVLLVLGSIGLLGLVACDHGGQGADFDPTVYYTKGEIDSYFVGAIPNVAQTDTVGPATSPLTTANGTYATGVPISGTIPEGALFVLVRAGFQGGEARTTLFLGDSATNHDSWTLPDNTGECLFLFNLRPNGTALSSDSARWWIDSAGSPSVLVMPILFFYDPTNGKP